MKKLLLIASMIWSVAYGQVCADTDTARSNAVSQISATTARINASTTHFSGSPVSLQLKYVRSGHTDTVTVSSVPSTALRNLTGLTPSTVYVYYYKTVCGSGNAWQRGIYTFTTLSNTIAYVDERPTRFHYLYADSVFQLPEADTSLYRAPAHPSITYRSANNTYYGYYPNCTCWRPLAIDSAGIIALLDGKVDSVTVSGDSLFYWKVGVAYGYVLPALNNVWRLTGNTGTDTSVNWIGTNDNKALKIRTNGVDRAVFGSNDSLYLKTNAYGSATNGSLLKLVDNTSGSTAWVAPGSIGFPISSLIAATGTNSINNAAYTQTWNWNTLAGNALELKTNSTTAASTQTMLYVNMLGANANSGQTTYGVQSINAHSGSSSTNIAGYFAASSGTNNYGLIVTGRVGFGTGTPGAQLEISAGSSAAGTAPIKFNAGAPTTSGVAGQLMYNTGLLILDSTSSHRDTLATRNFVRNNTSNQPGVYVEDTGQPIGSIIRKKGVDTFEVYTDHYGIMIGIVGVTTDFPINGATTLSNSHLIDKKVRIVKNHGTSKVLIEPYDFTHDQTTGETTFTTALATNDTLQVSTTPYVLNYDITPEPIGGYTYLDFPTLNNMVESPTHVWTSTVGGSNWGAFGLSNTSFTGDGEYIVQYNSTDGYQVMLGFNTSNTNEDYNGHYEFGVYISSNSGDLTDITSGTPGSSRGNATTGQWVRIKRAGTTVTIGKSTDKISWSTVYTFGGSSTGTLYLNLNVFNSSPGAFSGYYPQYK